MIKKEIVSIKASKAGPYSHGVKVGDFIFLSGQGPETGTKTIQEQTISAFQKIKTILNAANSSISDIVKVTVFLNNMDEFKDMNKAYRAFFEENGVNKQFPARTTVEVSDLPLPHMKLEIDVIASIEK